jgi:hypothetical protein
MASDDLRAKYILIQVQYEAFGPRALSLKGLATPLLGAGLAVGFKEDSLPVLLATILVALSLWLLEAMWKSFQYCLADRIKTLEAWYRGEINAEIPPFQIFTAWGEVWRRHYHRASSLVPILKQPFVYLPYVPMIIFGVLGCILSAPS